MKVLKFDHMLSTSVRVVPSAIAICTLGACGADLPRATAPSFSGVYSVRPYLVVPSIEPFESATMLLDVRDAQNGSMDVRGSAATWSSSNPSIVSVERGTATAHAPGDATITAAVGEVKGSVVVHVEWHAGARLDLPGPPAPLLPGDRFAFSPNIVSVSHHLILPQEVVWSSSNLDVGRIDVIGGLVVFAEGTTTIIGRYLGLVDSVRVDVSATPPGFGYFYSGNATVDNYFDETLWTPAAGMSFSTAGYVSVLWSSLYTGEPDLGWVATNSPARDIMMHVVSLDGMQCSAYLQPDVGYQFLSPGTPLVGCHDSPLPPYQLSVHMEFLAFRSGEFSGTVAMVRPGWSVVGASGRDSLFWFVTPGALNVASCAIAPADRSTSNASVICERMLDAPGPPVFYAVAFGPDARHGSAPIAFAEIDSGGVITRKVADGLELTTSASGPRSVAVTVTGARMAAFDRVPAVLVTAVAPTATMCSMTEPTRSTPTSVMFAVSCPNGVAGFTLGIVY
jgi:hypothetical protein